MSSHIPPTPLSDLAAAEASLVGQVAAIIREIDQVAVSGSSLDAAIAKLKSATAAAHKRIESMHRQVQQAVESVVQKIDLTSDELRDDASDDLRA